MFWERHETPGEATAAEFLCSRHGDDVEFEVSADPAHGAHSRPVVGGNRRRWVVKKIYLANEGEVTVDKWFVSSSINYTCTEGTSISLGLVFALGENHKVYAKVLVARMLCPIPNINL